MRCRVPKQINPPNKVNRYKLSFYHTHICSHFRIIIILHSFPPNSRLMLAIHLRRCRRRRRCRHRRPDRTVTIVNSVVKTSLSLPLSAKESFHFPPFPSSGDILLCLLSVDCSVFSPHRRHRCHPPAEGTCS